MSKSRPARGDLKIRRKLSLLLAVGKFCLTSPCTPTGTTLSLRLRLTFCQYNNKQEEAGKSAERFDWLQGASTKTIYVRHALSHPLTHACSVNVTSLLTPTPLLLQYVCRSVCGCWLVKAASPGQSPISLTLAR